MYYKNLNQITIDDSVKVELKKIYLGKNCYGNFKRVYLEMSFSNSTIKITWKLLDRFF